MKADDLLAARARELARPEATVDASQRTEALVMRLGPERYAIPAVVLVEVTRLEQLVPVPGAPDEVVGVASVRSSVVVVADLGRALGGSTADGPWLVVVGRDHAELGFRADFVDGFLAIEHGALLPPPATLGARGRRLVRGVTAGGVVLLDGAALLADPDFFYT